MNWLLSALLALGLAPPQVQPPIYRAGVYLVPLRIFTVPARELRNEDFRFVVDQTDYLPVETVADPDQRGAYIVYFAPARELRDGRTHDLVVHLRTNGKWNEFGKPFKLTLPAIGADGQTAPPVFREDVYAVPVHIALFDRKGGKDVPWVGLTLDDFVLLLEKKPFAAVAVSENPDRPGHYAIYFQPAMQHRDGKIHDVKLKVRINGKWKTLPTKWPTMLPKTAP